MIRFSALLSDNSKFTLYDSSYYNDKSVFWNHHLSNVYSFLIAICKTGFPLTITDENNATSKAISDVESLKVWISKNQSVDQDIYFSDVKDMPDLQNHFINTIGIFKEFLNGELERIRAGQFNVWHVYTSFDIFSKQVLIAQASLERLGEKWASKDKLMAMQDCFATLLSPRDDASELDIIAYAKQEHSKIDDRLLLILCKRALYRLEEKLEILIKK